jgi:hypothetical protein
MGEINFSNPAAWGSYYYEAMIAYTHKIYVSGLPLHAVIVEGQLDMGLGAS